MVEEIKGGITIGELIEKLSKYPLHYKVKVNDSDGVLDHINEIHVDHEDQDISLTFCEACL